MGFPQTVADQALVACNRSCCICHKFCGRKIELHHIHQHADGGPDTFENCIPLCFDCHSDMGKSDPKHPKGKHYTENELRMHRDAWYNKVKLSGSVAQQDICESDKKFFYKICEYFSSGMLRWLKDEDLRGLTPENIFDPLIKFLYDADEPFFHFLNTDLEKLLADLLEHCSAFIDYYTIHTFNVGKDNPHYRATHQWLKDNDYICRWCKTDEEQIDAQFDKEAKTINRYAKNAWESFNEFVQQGRRLLNE